MNARLVAALREISHHTPTLPYYWRIGSMLTLLDMGYVNRHDDGIGFQITPAGREKLAEMEKMK